MHRLVRFRNGGAKISREDLLSFQKERTGIRQILDIDICFSLCSSVVRTIKYLFLLGGVHLKRGRFKSSFNLGCRTPNAFVSIQ